MKSSYELTEKEFESLVHIAEKKYRSRIENYILRRSLAVVYDFLEKYNRIFALFVVLRFAQSHAPGEPDLPLCFQKDDEKAITRALDSLKSQLRAEHKRSGRAGEPARFAYVWARERDTSEHHHYHLVLLFDRDIYGYLGDYTKGGADNMGTRIQKAWCSAIGLDYFDYAYLPHFPKNHSAWFSRSDALALRPDYHNFLLRLAYLAKEYSKDFHDGNRNFGTSQHLV
ncbi:MULTISPECIES: inovirus Gp2 family protein [Enterobacteriaceae]|uniref:inovirus Gp2 family protein n=1 Tax=Enterobacteriaceae TaxID=543 RepID=UPI000668D535|nr:MULTISPECIES: inovirus Gp2 family protein [Enterobacteriaceae]MCU2734365.1 inovirus Gp2 family protein [Enterobacter hormaechei subsp. steigerwaltii]EJV1071799.1 inovirus Gp2 family protein [Klebsiella oxytoca]EKX3848663.1 inovirus Gp2 family protein [Klebsiella oxytoca]MBJ9233039.1 inovirus Gp2 family protein [Citrobacter koseri]MBX8881238.1 inovirus Gp2 family protein [Enterobacter ludwigii]